MKGYFDTVPIDLDESAKLDGAGHLFFLADRFAVGQTDARSSTAYGRSWDTFGISC